MVDLHGFWGFGAGLDVVCRNLKGWRLDGGFVVGVGGIRAFLFFVVHPLFHPLPGLTHFLCLAKESKQRKARPRWQLPLEFMSQRGEGKNSLRSDSFPSFFLSATEIQGAI
ncbi:hypothetical protein [Ralstonia wenshanensis]|uniref:hypothetical protein n=1 Tax=Ralstonia wenshanensis TaxID=2842456 RepID=UPI0021B2572E|nr:hypothetical protein [Ralstonia wenshanensis]MCT7308661.1 hypothetical protein [Ralstonia wenshanensis]